MRHTLLAVVFAGCAMSAASAATACGVVLSHRLPGETDAELVTRTERVRQDGLRARAESVFLAQVSAARMVGQSDGEYTLTPFFPLYDTPQPAQTVTMRDSPMSTACEVEPELGRVYVVYAERQGAGWRVIEIVRHTDLKDRPPGMPTARDVARGMYPLPEYPE